MNQILTIPSIYMYHQKLFWRQAVKNIVGACRNRMFVVNGKYFYMKGWVDMNDGVTLHRLMEAAKAPEFVGASAKNGDVFRIEDPRHPLENFHLSLCKLSDFSREIQTGLEQVLHNYYDKNARLFCSFRDGSFLYFGRGLFDDWCVYLAQPNSDKDLVLLDREYFTTLKTLANNYGAQKVYADFVAVYDATDGSVKQHTLNIIHRIAESYTGESRENKLVIEKNFAVLYAAMVAEIHKEHAPLGKRIKRHGVHKLLIENYDVERAADEDRKRPWREIAAECTARGF